MASGKRRDASCGLPSTLYWRPVTERFGLTPLTQMQWNWMLVIACGAYLVLRLSDVRCRWHPGET